jgi:hypothetical protein
MDGIMNSHCFCILIQTCYLQRKLDKRNKYLSGNTLQRYNLFKPIFYIWMKHSSIPQLDVELLQCLRLAYARAPHALSGSPRERALRRRCGRGSAPTSTRRVSTRSSVCVGGQGAPLPLGLPGLLHCLCEVASWQLLGLGPTLRSSFASCFA